MSGGDQYDFPYMPFFGYDFYDDDKVIQLADAGEAWYIRMLWHQWKTGAAPIDEQLARKIIHPEFGTRDEDWAKFYCMYPSLFPAIDEYQGRNPKVEVVRKESIRIFKAKRKGGKKSGETRRQQRDEREAA